MRHELHQPRINQDPRTDAVKHPVDDQRLLRPGRIRLPDPQPDSQGNRRGECVRQPQYVRCPLFALGPRDGREAGAQSKALERLVEDEHDVERVELGPGHGEREADEDGMEDDAELEDEDARHARGVVFEEGVHGRRVGAFVIECRLLIPNALVGSCVTEMVFAGDVVDAGAAAAAALGVARGGLLVEFGAVMVAGGEVLERCFVIVQVRGGKDVVAHDHQLDEEEDEDGHQGNAFDPVVLGDGASKAGVCQGIIGGGEELRMVSCGLRRTEEGIHEHG